MATQAAATSAANLQRGIINSVMGGLAGGLVFGIMMAMQNMLPMVGMLVGQDNPFVGFIVHLFISAFIGASYGVIYTRLSLHGWAAHLIAGALYGVIWWVLGALVLMPLMLGMNAMVFQIGDPQIMSLMGHAIFGVIMGAANKILADRAA